MGVMAGLVAGNASHVGRLAADGAAHQLHVLVQPGCQHLAPVQAFLQDGNA